MDFLSDEENESEIESIRLLANALEADKCDKATVISSQYSVNSVSTVTASHTQSEVTFTNRIETALAFNKIMEDKLKRLESVLMKRLEECKARLTEVHKMTSDQSREPTNFRYVTCGRPYFKDSAYFRSPANADTITMQQSKMYDFNNVTCLCGWTVKDKRDFASAILKASREAKRKELRSEIARLKREALETDVNVDKICNKLSKQIDQLHKKKITELAFPLDKEYDWDAFSSLLKNRHKAQEFRAMWKLYLHPSINKAEWSRQEQDKLLKIAAEHEYRDWDEIAKELNSGRTGYQCFVFFRTNMSNSSVGQKWTREEEEYLRRLIAVYRDGSYIPWPKIAAQMGTRTKMQIYGKYLRLQDNKGRFHKEEDDVLLTCVSKFGTDFRRIANEFLVNRSYRQLKSRYRQLNSSTRISTMWTIEEDRRLIQFVSHNDPGSRGSVFTGINFANLVEHFPGKTRAHLRTRYVTLVRWMRLHPRGDIAKAPRRGVRRLGHGGVVDDLSTAIDRLKKKLTSECEKKPKYKKLSLHSSEHELDDAMTTTVINEERKQEAENQEQAISINEGKTFLEPQVLNSQHLTNLLILLRAKLNKNVFERSRNWAAKYPDLISGRVTTAKPPVLACYSRKKKPATETKMLGATDIWGNALLSHTEFVIPPHFATITGLRKLMQYVVDYKDTIDSHNFSRKNAEVKDQYDLLLNRFHQLFLWPMILSNHQPRENQTEKATTAEASETSAEEENPRRRKHPRRETDPKKGKDPRTEKDPKKEKNPRKKLPDLDVTIPEKLKRIQKRRKGETDNPFFKMDEDDQILLQDITQMKPFSSFVNDGDDEFI